MDYFQDIEMRIKQEEVKQGTLIHKEKPFVFILSSKMRTENCDFCFKKGKLLKCSGCRYVYYCDRGCQREGWTIHKPECKNLKKVAPRVIPDAARLLARLIKKLEMGGQQIKAYYTKTNYRMYKDLMSHYPNLKNDQKRMEHFTSICGVLFEFLGDQMLPNSAELMGMYGRMCVNSFNICNQELQSLGTGIYLGASILDHSCKPNAMAMFEGTTLHIRSLETLPCLDFSKIFICYIDVLASTQERQEELLSTYYFTCQCVKCLNPEPLDEMTGAACPNSSCDNFIAVNSIKPVDSCGKCGAVVGEEFLNRYREVLDFTVGHLDNMKNITYLDVCKVCLKKQEGLFYKHNLKHVKILDLAFESSIDFEQFDDARDFGLELIDSYYKYYGKLHNLTGLLHLKLGKIFMYQNRIKEAVEHIQKANDIMKITHGINSSLYNEELVPLLQQIVMFA